MQIIISKDIPNHYQLTTVLKKKVIAQNGEVIGRVKEVAFDLNKVVGIFISGKILMFVSSLFPKAEKACRGSAAVL